MKRLFFSALALTLGAFVFWSCDNDDELDKEKPAERGTFMTVQQQNDAFQDNLNSIVEAIDFTELSSAAEIVANEVGKKWSLMSLMPLSEDSVLMSDTAFISKMSYAMQLATGNYESFEDMDIDLRPLYMAADVYVVDSVFYGDTIPMVSVQNVKHDVDYLLLNVFIEDHAITFKARMEQGDNEFEYENVERKINATFALPELVEMTLTLDGKVLADVKGELESDYTAVVKNDGDKTVTINGSKTSAKGYVKVAGYELNGELNFDKATGANAKLAAKYGTSELISMNYNMDATMVGVDMTDSAQVIAWIQNPEKLKSISMNASLCGGNIEFKFKTFNPFKDEELAKILRSQMMPGAKLTEEQKVKMCERINEILDGGFYFKGFKDPQAKLKFVYREIADKAKPITDNEEIVNAVGADAIDLISEVLFKLGAYTMLVVHDDEGYEKEIQLEEYFTGINTESLKQALLEKILGAFGPVIAQFVGDEE